MFKYDIDKIGVILIHFVFNLIKLLVVDCPNGPSSEMP